MKRYLIIISVIIFSVPAFSQREIGANNEVRKVTNSININGRQLVYALPKNVIRVKFTVKETESIPGPYAPYAEKYLNISEGVIFTDHTFFEITDAEFLRYSIPDSLNYYTISYSGARDFPALQLNSDGVIVACNADEAFNGYNQQEQYLSKPEVIPDDFYYTDLGVKPFLEEKSETLYRTIRTDSSVTRVPYTQDKYVPTTNEMDANEAAALIRKLRKRRFKLMIGLKEEVVVPEDGKALEIMVNELNTLEREYLELFTGRTFEREHTYYFDFFPEADAEAEEQILGWFSPTLGVSSSKPDVRRSDYKPLIIKSSLTNKSPGANIQIMDKSEKNPVAIKHGLYYRIPGRSLITLQYTDQILARQYMELAQKGTVLSLPVDYLNSSLYGIEFYPETGALKRVFKKQKMPNQEN